MSKYNVRKHNGRLCLFEGEYYIANLSDETTAVEGEEFEEEDIEGFMWGGNRDNEGYIIIKGKQPDYE